MEDIDVPRVAQWIDDEELDELQEPMDDGSTSSDSEGVDEDGHSASEAWPSRRLVSTSCMIRPLPFC